MDHFTATHMETNPLLIPADPFEAIINAEVMQSAELKRFAGWNRLFMERLEIRYANWPFVRCLFEAEKVFLSLSSMWYLNHSSRMAVNDASALSRAEKGDH